jgi:hypothetical protein
MSGPKEVPQHVKRQAKERLMLILQKQKAPAGSARAAWDKWTVLQRRIVLTIWCKANSLLFENKLWFQLSKWIRKSIKRFFRQELYPGNPMYSLRHEN